MRSTGATTSQPDVVAARPATSSSTARPALVWLTEPVALDPDLVGAKGANLAAAAVAGLPVLPGFVITTRAPRRVGLVLRGPFGKVLRDAWATLTNDGGRPVVVRSSSTVEDGSASSMAGMFESITDVRDYKAFLAAVERVLRSAATRLAEDRAPAPMAVLVQPHLEPRVSGIMFGLDPLTGRSDRVTVVAIEGGPEPLVSGRAEGHEYSLSPAGRVLRKARPAPGLLGLRDRRALVELARRAATRFGRPQDIEWSIDHGGSLVLFQTRPVTAVGSVGTGPVLGPGPVAETFPDPLTPLEIDLWVEPLRAAIEHSLRIAGAASRGRISRSPVVTTVGGRVAADLDLLGASPRKTTLWQRLNPAPPARRVGAAWRVGRLNAALPTLSARLVRTVDAHLAQVPDPSELTNEQLLNVLLRTRRTLVSLHGYEVLAGMIGRDDEDAHATAAGLGLHALGAGRAQGLADDALTTTSPEVLALLPPSIVSTRALPPAPHMTTPETTLALGARESLRLRIRWVQELSARTARELGRRLVPAGHLSLPDDVSLLTLEELEEVVLGGRAPAASPLRVAPASPPLPNAFRLSDEGTAVPVDAGDGRGSGAGGGRGMGRVHHGRTPAHGDVLVVQSLDPELAHLLPTLGGLVSETGNILSHLAILAREFGVPTVVGVNDARAAFSDGDVVVVDGSTGEVFQVEES
jgi:rifampicin phosphotransferase